MAAPKLINFNTLIRDPEKPATLYRTNTRYGNIGTNMNNIYTDDRGTYFTLHPAKLTEYFQRSGPKGKGFRRKEDAAAVQLLDMRNAATVQWIKSQEDVTEAEKAAIDRAFPIGANGSVKRFSSAETKHLDDIALAAIGRIAPREGAVGYYSEEQRNGNDVTFHEEVGLARSGFNRFSVAEHIAPTRPMGVAGKKRPQRSRFFNPNSDSNNSNSNNSNSNNSNSNNSDSNNSESNSNSNNSESNNSKSNSNLNKGPIKGRRLFAGGSKRKTLRKTLHKRKTLRKRK